MFSATILTLLTAAMAALAHPTSRCSTAGDTITFPDGTGALPPPPAGDPSFVALGVGVQNYTCASTGTFTSTGAVAELFNLACFPEADFESATDKAFARWSAEPAGVTAFDLIARFKGKPFVLGQHFFITNPITGSGLSPKWDFTSASEAGHADAFVVGARTGDVPAPTDPTVNVDWLSLSAVSGLDGDLASNVYRVQTRGGQPPASCTPGTPDISMRYVSQYWFFGGAF